jgi:hypothetical protein
VGEVDTSTASVLIVRATLRWHPTFQAVQDWHYAPTLDYKHGREIGLVDTGVVGDDCKCRELDRCGVAGYAVRRTGLGQ